MDMRLVLELVHAAHLCTEHDAELQVLVLDHYLKHDGQKFLVLAKVSER